MSWKDVLQVFTRSITPKSKLERDPHLGSLTQFPDVTKDLQNKQIVLGLDFGTAFTKVILGDERIRYAVPLRGKPNGIDSYLLPCTFWIGQDGTCSLATKNGRQVTEIKMRMLNGDLGHSLQQEMCAYLALVLRRSRAYFFSEYESVYKKNYIHWLVNVGLPTSSYHDKKLVSFYKKIVQAAWLVSIQKDHVTLSLCADVLASDFSKIQMTEALHEEAISPFPEFVAQITGYVRSPMRNNDLHFFVDVGAGTVDATVFNIHQVDGEDRFPIFAKTVKPLGTHYLVKNRLKNFNGNSAKEFDIFADVPNIKDFARLTKTDIPTLRRIDKYFKKSLLDELRNALDYTKARRYPLSRAWTNGIPLFLCGGGSNCDFYIESIINENHLNRYKLSSKSLPKPENLKAEKVGNTHYNRLSVAYGLSFDPFDIGEIIKMEDIEDILPEAATTPNEKTQKSIYCPRCKGTGGMHGFCEKCGGSGYFSPL